MDFGFSYIILHGAVILFVLECLDDLVHYDSNHNQVPRDKTDAKAA